MAFEWFASDPPLSPVSRGCVRRAGRAGLVLGVVLIAWMPLAAASDYAAYYESLWGEPPVYQAASATAAALALHLAIEAAGSTDTDSVRKALRGLSADTFYGPISFDERGVNVGKPMGTIQVQDDEILVVAPDAAAVAELRYPLDPG